MGRSAKGLKVTESSLRKAPRKRGKSLTRKPAREGSFFLLRRDVKSCDGLATDGFWGGGGKKGLRRQKKISGQGDKKGTGSTSSWHLRKHGSAGSKSESALQGHAGQAGTIKKGRAKAREEFVKIANTPYSPWKSLTYA